MEINKWEVSRAIELITAEVQEDFSTTRRLLFDMNCAQTAEALVVAVKIIGTLIEAAAPDFDMTPAEFWQGFTLEIASQS